MAEKLFAYKNITEDKVFLVDELSNALIIEKGEVLRLTYLEVLKYSKPLSEMLNAKFIQIYEDPVQEGVKSFTDLNDVPSSYTGQQGKFLAVGQAGVGLVFLDPSTEESLRGPQGLPGEPGAPFVITKIYDSVSAMEADFGGTEVSMGQFVIIETQDTEDPDNSKLYIKGQTQWEFITDLSGSQGIQGPAGETPILRSNGGWLQFSVDKGSSWQNLVSLSSLTPSFSISSDMELVVEYPDIP